ncbi:proteasome subunit alpha [Natronoglomus mannanivorans]|uniref:Proteasome subunit alpha n=1 Tax=Natronoglomus mannanivorans TaxID=2979990 RepID=A0AAP3E368_9EURY|nr:proteasome subunit alpha [Halobacteria archaeon AArc-xg1-1]
MTDRIESIDRGREFGVGPRRGMPEPERGRLEREHRSIGSQIEHTEDAGVVKTGTTTVAVAGSDGVVLGADTRASVGGGRFVANRTTQKIEPIGDRAAVAFSGSVSDAQSFVRQLRAESRLYELEHGTAISLESLATLAGGLVRRGPYRVLDLLLAGVEDDGVEAESSAGDSTDVGAAVYDIGPGGGVMTADYAASGSGMQLAYGALEGTLGEATGTKTVGDLRPIVASAVRSATARDTASGDGMTVATVTTDGVERERFDELETAVEAVAPTVGDDVPAGEEVR